MNCNLDKGLFCPASTQMVMLPSVEALRGSLSSMRPLCRKLVRNSISATLVELANRFWRGRKDNNHEYIDIAVSSGLSHLETKLNKPQAKHASNKYNKWVLGKSTWMTFWNTSWASASGKTSRWITTEFRNSHVSVHAQLPFPVFVFHKFYDRISQESSSEIVSLDNTQQISPWVDGMLPEDGLNNEYNSIGLEGSGMPRPRFFSLSTTLTLLYYKLNWLTLVLSAVDVDNY